MAYGYRKSVGIKTGLGAMLAGAASIASVAYAGTTLVGGGDTMSALGYGGDVTHQQILPVAGSFFATFTSQAGNPLVSYCQTGGGLGKYILTGALGTNVQYACQSVTPAGFGAGAVGRTDLTQPNFVASDIPLAAADYDQYVANRPKSKPVQFPAIAGSIALTFNKAGVDTLALTDALVCKIFSGQIADWADAQLIDAGVPAGVRGPINVVYHSDGNGTTFAFSNHLTAVCPGTGTVHFTTDPLLTKVVSLYWPTGLHVPNNWIGVFGDQGVVNMVASTDGAIGYAATANVLNALAPIATLNGLDPAVDFPAAPNGKFNINSSDVAYNTVISGVDATTGRPVTTYLAPASLTACIALVRPSAYANPSTGYPIVSISYLMANSNGNGVDAVNVSLLLGAPYNSAIIGNTNLHTIGAGTGLAFLGAPFSQPQFAACIVN